MYAKFLLYSKYIIVTYLIILLSRYYRDMIVQYYTVKASFLEVVWNPRWWRKSHLQLYKATYTLDSAANGGL